MAVFSWSEALAVNVKDLDDQHKRLVALVNDLSEAMRVGKGKDVMEKVLTDLVEYTKYHFSTEEKLMQAHAYAGYLGHKKAHDDLTRQAGDLLAKVKSGNMVVSVEVMNFLKDWVTRHIMSEDKKYGPFFNGKGIR